MNKQLAKHLYSMDVNTTPLKQANQTWHREDATQKAHKFPNACFKLSHFQLTPSPSVFQPFMVIVELRKHFRCDSHISKGFVKSSYLGSAFTVLI